LVNRQECVTRSESMAFDVLGRGVIEQIPFFQDVARSRATVGEIIGQARRYFKAKPIRIMVVRKKIRGSVKTGRMGDPSAACTVRNIVVLRVIKIEILRASLWELSSLKIAAEKCFVRALS